MGGEEKGKGEMYGERNVEIHNTICKIDSQWEFAVWLRELKHGLCDNLEGRDRGEMEGRFRREGTWVYLWLIFVDVWQKTTKFCKGNILKLKKLSGKKKKRLLWGFLRQYWSLAWPDTQEAFKICYLLKGGEKSVS